MSNNVDFSAILNKKANEVEAPASFPVGSYDLVVLQYSTGVSSKQQTPFIEFEFGVQNPREDVDMDEYNKIKNPSEKHLKAQFYLTDGSLFRLKDFLKTCGLDVECDRSLAEILPESIGCSVIGLLKKELSQDGTKEFTRLNSFISAE